jgi:uncharacterized protein with HEPN domain
MAKRDNTESDETYVDNILQAIGAIRSFVHGKHVGHFRRSRMMRDAIVRNIEIIGEATKGLSRGFKSRHPDIEWAEIAKMRDLVAHRYWAIDPEIVWATAKKDIRQLANKLKRRRKPRS